MNERVIILQRVVPHYRATLFHELWKEFGWRAVVAANPPASTHLSLVSNGSDWSVTYPFHFSPVNATRCRVPTRRILRELRPTAVIAEFSLQMSSTYELLAHRKLVGSPLVVFWSHGYNMDRGLGPTALPIQIVRGALGLAADAHVVYSEEGRRFLQKFIEPSRVKVVRNSLAHRGRPPHHARPPGPGPRLVSVGRMTADKDFPALIRVFRGLRREFPSATLTLIGDGPDADRTRGELLGLPEEAVRLVGELYDERGLEEYFANADLALFAGAVGLSVDHALWHGVPVVAFDRTPSGPNHHPEIAYVIDGVTGLRVEEYDEAAMVRAVRDFLRRYPDPKRAFGDSIRRFVATHLTLDAILDDFRQVERMICDLSRGAAR